MSRTVTLVRLPANIRSIRELPSDFKPDPLGSREWVLSQIAEIFPDAKSYSWDDIVVNTQDGYAEIMLDQDDPVTWICLVNPTNSVIRTFSKQTGWCAVNDNTGDLMNFD